MLFAIKNTEEIEFIINTENIDVIMPIMGMDIFRIILSNFEVEVTKETKEYLLNSLHNIKMVGDVSRHKKHI